MATGAVLEKPILVRQSTTLVPTEMSQHELDGPKNEYSSKFYDQH